MATLFRGKHIVLEHYGTDHYGFKDAHQLAKRGSAAMLAFLEAELDRVGAHHDELLEAQRIFEATEAEARGNTRTVPVRKLPMGHSGVDPNAAPNTRPGGKRGLSRG